MGWKPNENKLAKNQVNCINITIFVGDICTEGENRYQIHESSWAELEIEIQIENLNRSFVFY
jgi:hypothetical protein